LILKNKVIRHNQVHVLYCDIKFVKKTHWKYLYIQFFSQNIYGSDKWQSTCKLTYCIHFCFRKKLPWIYCSLIIFLLCLYSFINYNLQVKVYKFITIYNSTHARKKKKNQHKIFFIYIIFYLIIKELLIALK
jgi:hypothetical protein